MPLSLQVAAFVLEGLDGFLVVLVSGEEVFHQARLEEVNRERSPRVYILLSRLESRYEGDKEEMSGKVVWILDKFESMDSSILKIWTVELDEVVRLVSQSSPKGTGIYLNPVTEPMFHFSWLMTTELFDVLFRQLGSDCLAEAPVELAECFMIGPICLLAVFGLSDLRVLASRRSMTP